MVGHVDEGRLVAGRYRLLERIGRGGMGTVWRAEDELLGRQVAVKKLHPPQPHMDDDELATLFERTRREARAAARISHPNVVVVHDVVDDEGLPSIVMEYVPSETLGERLKREGPLPPAEVARIGRGMIAALRAAHRAGVLHRDVKPGNVLLGLETAATRPADRARAGTGGGAGDDGAPGGGEAGGGGEARGGPGGRGGPVADPAEEYAAGRVVLTDFGIAQASGTSTLTRTGELIGSIDFLSPERIRGVAPGPEADLWALGATLYQAVEGSSPFRRPTAIETAYAIAEEPVRPAEHAGVLTRVIAGLLAKEPADRLSAEQAEQMLRVPAADPDTALVTQFIVRPAGAEGAMTRVPHNPPAEQGSPGAGAYGGDGQSYGAQMQAYGGSGQSYGALVQVAGRPPYPVAGRLLPQLPQPPARGRRVAPWLAGALTVTLLAGGAAYAVHRLGRGEAAGPAAGPSVTAATTPATTPPTVAPTTAPATTPPPPVPDGYRLAAMPERGYAVPVPQGWTRHVTQGGDEVDFVDPTGKVGLKISALDFASTSPYRHFTHLEPQTRSQVDDYHRERLDETTQSGEPAAIWEFTFEGKLRRYHAIDLGFGRPGGTEYAVYLSAPDASWQEYRPVFDNAVAGFRQTTP